MSFGYFYGGIYIIQLDKATGQVASGATCIHLANRIANFDAIEGSYIYRHGGYYYLFVSLDFCCQGVLSTYHIGVGRSSSVTGPYYDRGGLPMTRGELPYCLLRTAASLARVDKLSCMTGAVRCSSTTTMMGTTTDSLPLDSIIWTGALTAGLYSEMISDQSWGETVLHMPDSISVISDVMKTVSSLRRKLAQGTKQAVHLIECCNVPDRCAAFRLSVPLEDAPLVERVVVPVPGEDAALGEKSGNRLRRMIPDAERKSRAKFLKPFRVGDSVDAYTRNPL